MNLTYRFRIKDSNSRKLLSKLASKVNSIWNYVNSIHHQNNAKYRSGLTPSFLSYIDIAKLLNGASKEYGLTSESIRAVADKYVTNRKTAKKTYLSWRSYKRSLGWIPFQKDVKLTEDTVIHNKHIFRIYKHRSLPEGTKIKCGSFHEDSQGRWFVSLTVDVPPTAHRHPKDGVGIDLGIKTAAALSDGTFVERPMITDRFSLSLAKAQRARKKNRVKKIHQKIKDCRSDYLHKETLKIAQQFKHIFVGDVKTATPMRLGNKGLNRNVSDASWHQIRTLLEYKARRLGGVFRIVNERYSTQQCYFCSEKTGPKGLGGLSVREWACTNCGASHNRDTNSAKHILRTGYGTLTGASL